MTVVRCSQKNGLWCLFLLGFAIHYVETYRHPGESLFLPDERTSLDDCHLRFYQFNGYGGGGIGGFPATQFEFAHMGAIGWIQPGNDKILWQCGGSLIWDNFVLTAAHCVVDSRNAPPDVVRFGDLDIFSTIGDEFAQQLKIVEIIRHPSHRFASHYHDVALLRLEKGVRINEAVIPACLWLNTEVPFKRIHATGWGNVGFVGNQSPVLLKMELDPISYEECSKVYNNGDSGGPLQVKLMHNMRQTPFIIGVTSFGLICGTSTPGVYTRVASYHQWIIDTMRKRGADVDENTYNSTTCVHRHIKYREFYDGVVAYREGNGSVGLNYFNYMFSTRNGVPSGLAKLGWSEGNGISDCAGVIVDEDTVLTVADCAESNGILVERIVHPKIVNISKVYIHPRYKKGTSYNNIAVLKLDSLLDIRVANPRCIWVDRDLPFRDAQVTGVGRADLIEALYAGYNFTIDPAYVYLTLRNILRNSSSCMVGDRAMSKVQHGIAQEHVCAGYDLYIVPEMCSLVRGAAIERYMEREERLYTFTLALSQFGKDCGFGDHMIATRLASHVEWLNSILLPKYRDFGSKLQFVDPDLEEQDRCEVDSDMPGRCVRLSECLHYWQHEAHSGKVVFCSSSKVICCPNALLERNASITEKTELERCPQIVHNLKPFDRNGSLVQIGFDAKDWYDFRCIGSIITAQLILTTASCFRNEVPLVVQLTRNKTIVPIEAIIVHKGYNATDQSNDLAIIKLSEPLIWSSHLFPICLWTNQSHTPVIMRLIELTKFRNVEKLDHEEYDAKVANGNTFSTRFMMPQYNTDCQRVHPFRLQSSQLCARDPLNGNTCARSGDALQADGIDGIFYLVGLAQPSVVCGSQKYITLTRISRQLNWIKQSLDADYWDF
ncbi:uncharacterized protein LOC134217285 isoform X2 [Armigeres subalbatus]|uniref:uncharacterized protein LOC134217285 isoform X2 n=1 Tax=Armigeres subalbatus TaxID=124917 RepID=UPI002ED45617